MAWRGRTVAVVGLAAGQTAAFAGTAFLDGLGTEWWHHIASLAFVLALAFAMPGRMRSRRFLAVGVLATSILATVSGFWLLYWKEGLRADGFQDWGVFWHVAWSWAAAVFFWQHTWVNRVSFAHFFRRSLRSLRPASAHIGLYLLAVAALAATWAARGWFTSENYVSIGLWAWIAATVAAVASWALLRRRPDQKAVRGGVDLGLVPIAALAVVSGFPLLFFDPQFDAAGLKYASKVWHVWPSIVFALLVFVHSAQVWRTVRVHWRKLAQPSA